MGKFSLQISFPILTCCSLKLPVSKIACHYVPSTSSTHSYMTCLNLDFGNRNTQKSIRNIFHWALYILNLLISGSLILIFGNVRSILLERNKFIYANENTMSKEVKNYGL